MDQDLKNTWKDTLELIKISVSQGSFATWFKGTHISKLEDLGERYLVEIGCLTSFVKNTIESRYFGLIQDSLTKVTGKKCELSFIIKDNPDKAKTQLNSETPLFTDSSSEDTLELAKKAKIRPSFT